MSTRGRRIETVKSVIMVVLFVTTILLLYLIWSGGRPGRVIPAILRGGGSSSASASWFIVPDYVAYGKGDGSFTLADDPSAALTAAAAQCARFSSLSSPMLSPITEEQYRTAMTGYESAQLFFRYSMPAVEFLEYYGAGRVSSADGIGDFTCLAFSEASPESIFFSNDTEGRYYRLLFGSAPEELSYKFTPSSEAAYYYTGDVLGGGATAMIALGGESDLAMSSYVAEPEADPMLSTEIARAAFGDTFDFVRRIRDSFGNLTYMYGYGTKVLNCLEDGSYEYYGEAGSQESLGFFYDLTTAVQFIESCGGIPADSGRPIGLQLFGAIKLAQSRNPGYVFGFVQTIDGVPVLSDSGCSIEIEVSGGQVTRMRRAVAVSDPAKSALRPVLEPANVLASNCNHIYNISTNSMLSVEPSEAFNYVANEVRSVRAGYYAQTGIRRLTPCWTVLTPSARFFFDMYDGTPLGFDLIGD